MKRINKYVVVLLALFICYSCNENKDKTIKVTESEYITSFIRNIDVKENIKWVVILPGMGCHGCIQEGEAFMKDNILNQDILFILTSIESLKILQHKIGIIVKDHSNIYIDRENQFHIPTDNAIYPCIVQLEKGRIKKHEFQSPQNSEAFNNLKSRISE